MRGRKMEREEIKRTLYEMMSELLEREVDDIDESKALMDELDISSLDHSNKSSSLNPHHTFSASVIFPLSIA